MSKLYEIAQEIERIQERVEWDGEQYVDLDTGEIMSEEDLQALFQSLNMDKKEILTWMAKCVINDRAEADALTAEEKRLKARREAKEKRVERFLAILDRECAGEKTDLGVATVSYRASHPLEVEDDKALISWLESNGYDECVKYADPEIRKADVTKLIKSGVKVPGAKIGDKVNMSLK